MKIYNLKTIQRLPITIEKAWDFFSSPINLSKITPDSMGFTTTSPVPEKMYPGLIITYTVKPLLGIKVNWMTEITHVNKPFYFVDEQRAGPYKIWHHEHHFREIDGGVEMEDIVHYVLPFGIIANMVHPIIVKPQLNKIFSYRSEILMSMFGEIE